MGKTEEAIMAAVAEILGTEKAYHCDVCGRPRGRGPEACSVVFDAIAYNDASKAGQRDRLPGLLDALRDARRACRTVQNVAKAAPAPVLRHGGRTIKLEIFVNTDRPVDDLVAAVIDVLRGPGDVKDLSFQTAKVWETGTDDILALWKSVGALAAEATAARKDGAS